MVIDDLKILLGLDDTQDPLLSLYIRKATTLIAFYLNVPIVIELDKPKFLPSVPTETIDFPDTPISTTSDDGVKTTSQPSNIETTYPDAVIEYVTICMNRQGNEGIKQAGLGSQSQTYTSDLPESVIALLPVPFVTMLNVRRS